MTYGTQRNIGSIRQEKWREQVVATKVIAALCPQYSHWKLNFGEHDKTIWPPFWLNHADFVWKPNQTSWHTSQRAPTQDDFIILTHAIIKWILERKL